ncbi:IMP dehydrogenase [Candidatus Gottesmanbacteria bacterium]|nr:IMP dehydrogenase [Candidatus Gottesmanbacteria bacterium]
MPLEIYDYRDNPYVEDFKKFVRDSETQIHPWIQRREQEARAITDQISTLEIPASIDTEFLIQQEDQGLILTPFDNFDGMRVAILPQEHIEGARILREFNLRLANHPARIHAMQALEARGFIAPIKMEGVLDSEAEKRRLLQLADLGHAIDLTDGTISGEQLTKLADKIKILRETDNDAINASSELQKIQQDVEITIQQTESKRQSHRTELLATGPFTLIKGKAFSYIQAGAMPDITASVIMGRTLAKMLVPFCIPEIGIYSDPNKQAALAKAIMDGLTEDDPLLAGRSPEEKKYIVSHWRQCPIGVTEVNPDKALKRAELLSEVGITWLRPYIHTVGGDIITTTRELRRHYPDAIIEAGQVSSIDIALGCEYAGADCLNSGVGSGGRCTTALLSQLIPTNALLSWKLRGKLGIPLKGEGGAVDEPIVSALTGFSAVNGSGKFGGVIENPGGIFFLTRDGRTFLKPYRGEASQASKYLSGKTYATGIPFVPEGEEAFKILVPLEESATQKIVNQWTRVNLGAIVLGIDAGPHIISAMQNLDPSPLWQKSRTAAYLQDTH